MNWVNCVAVCSIFVALISVCQSQVPGVICDEQSITSCWAPIDGYLNAIALSKNVSRKSMPTSNLTDPQLDEFCLLWTGSPSVCLAALRNQCPEYKKLEFEGIEDALNFFCNSLTRYKTFKQCLAKFPVQYGLNICDRRLSQDIFQASNRGTVEKANKAMCNAVYKSVKCDGSVVGKNCGTDAKTWMEEYQTFINKPYLDGIHSCSDIGFCTNQNIDNCWSPVNTYLKSIGKGDINTLDFMFHTLDSIQLVTFCITYDLTVSSCLSKLNDTCSISERMLFEGQELQLDFLCKEGMQEFVRHKSCYTNPSVTAGMDECSATYNRQVTAANRLRTPAETDKAYCRAIKAVVECDKQVVSTSCTAKSGEWIYEYKLRLFKPLLEELKCEEISLHCVQSNIDACWKPVEDFKKSIGFTDATQGFALFHLTESQVRKYCSIYSAKVSDCLATIRPFCNSVTRKRFEGLEDSLDFLCMETLDEYIKHKTCIGSTPTQAGMARCTSQFNKDIAEIVKPRKRSLSTSEVENMYCDAVSDNLNCDEKAVADECGREAGVWTMEYQMKYLEPYLDHIGCSVKGMSSGRKALIALLVLGAIALIAGLGIFGWHYYTKKRAEKAQTEHVRFDNPLSVPPAINGAASSVEEGKYGNDRAVNVEKIDPTKYENQLYGANPTTDSGDMSETNQYINTDEIKPEL